MPMLQRTVELVLHNNAFVIFSTLLHLYGYFSSPSCSFLFYVAANATYIRLLHGKIGILEGFFGTSSVHRGPI